MTQPLGIVMDRLMQESVFRGMVDTLHAADKRVIKKILADFRALSSVKNCPDHARIATAFLFLHATREPNENRKGR